MPRKALDEQAKANDARSAGSRESLSRPAPLTTEGDSHLPLGRRGRVIQMRRSRNLNYFFFRAERLEGAKASSTA